MNEIEVVASLGALAQPLRLRVFRELVTAGDTGLTPGLLGERLDVPGATLSFHLRELLHAGLFSQVRQSRNLIYRAEFEQMNALLGYLNENCCATSPWGVAAASCTPARKQPYQAGPP
jgi:ArsR family transcriptional regulator, arsenate/arsenite/antimonite-responsive transcriptional repressor